MNVEYICQGAGFADKYQTTYLIFNKQLQDISNIHYIENKKANNMRLIKYLLVSYYQHKIIFSEYSFNKIFPHLYHFHPFPYHLCRLEGTHHQSILLLLFPFCLHLFSCHYY